MAVTTIRGGRQISDATVPYADIQNVTANTILGNNTASAAAIQEVSLSTNTLLGRGASNITAITLGTGLSISTNSLTLATNLQSLTGLSYSSLSFVKMSAAGTFSLDTTTYLSGSGTSGYIAFYNTANTLTNESALYWDSTNNYLGINMTGGAPAPLKTLSVNGPGTNVEVIRIGSTTGGDGATTGEAYIGFHHWSADGASRVYPPVQIGVIETANGGTSTSSYDASFLIKIRDTYGTLGPGSDSAPTTRFQLYPSGQIALSAYTATNSFTGTPIGGLAYTNTGNIISTQALTSYTGQTTSFGTTTLTVSSSYTQYFIGSSSQTVVLPDVTTLVNGFSFCIINRSTGAVTVQTSGLNTIVAMPYNTRLIVTCVNTAGGTGTTSWSWTYSSYNESSLLSGVNSSASTSVTLTTSSEYTQIYNGTANATYTLFGSGAVAGFAIKIINKSNFTVTVNTSSGVFLTTLGPDGSAIFTGLTSSPSAISNYNVEYINGCLYSSTANGTAITLGTAALTTALQNETLWVVKANTLFTIYKRVRMRIIFKFAATTTAVTSTNLIIRAEYGSTTTLNSASILIPAVASGSIAIVPFWSLQTTLEMIFVSTTQIRSFLTIDGYISSTVAYTTAPTIYQINTSNTAGIGNNDTGSGGTTAKTAVTSTADTSVAIRFITSVAPGLTMTPQLTHFETF